jgi:hypothetical protein
MKTKKYQNRLMCILLCFIFLPAFSMADYQANIDNALAAYKQNDLMLAYKYYFLAYKETPSVKLANVLKFLKTKILAAKNAGAVQVKAKDAGFPWKWVLIGGDIVFLGATIATGMDYNKEADKYDVLYGSLNNTTMDNYAALQKEDAVFKSKQGVFVAFAVLTVLAVGYTAADLFFVHAAFPAEPAVSYNPANSEIKMAVNYRF